MHGTRTTYSQHVVTVVGLLALAAGCLLAAVALSGSSPGRSGTTIKAVTPTAASLAPGAEVVMAGVKVGRVARIQLGAAGTVVDLDIQDRRVLPLPDDSSIAIRSRTVIGENYVAITRGGSRTELAKDQVLEPKPGDEYVDVDQILSVLQGDTRARARQFIRSSGAALEGRGEQFNQTLRGTTRFIDSSAPVLRTLAQDRSHVAVLADRIGRLSDAVSERDGAVQAIAKDGLVTFRALASRDHAVSATLAELPATLRELRSGAAALSSASITAAPVLRDAAAAARALTPAVERLRPAADAGRKLVASVGRAVEPLTGTANRLAEDGPTIGAALPKLRRVACQLNPMLRYLVPYVPDALATVSGLGSAANSYDAIGHLIRLSPIVGENSLAGLPASVEAAATTLMRAGLLGKVTPLTWNPYPDPGKVGTEAAGQGHDVPDANALGSSGYHYPRITADC
jgi:phospholipid/cholesterol/gamma-HCH transport system substrate-binding protein